MELVKNIAAIIGLILSVTSVLTLCTKWGRSFVFKIIKDNTKDLQDINQKQNETIESINDSLNSLVSKIDELTNDNTIIKEILVQQCRNVVKNIYYKYHNAKKIPLYERKTVDKTYEIYHNQLGGNSYVQLLYNEICKWEIDTVSYPILEED